jgi:Antibiotic biosynthesis monooxygenase
MWTAIREYRMTAGSVDDLMHKVDVGLADVFADQEGFLSYEVLDAGEGRIVSITTFTDRPSAQNSNELAADFVRDELAEFGLARTGHMTGEVMVSRAGSRMLEPVHH